MRCVGICLALLAVACVVFGNEECKEEKMEECKEMLLNIMLSDKDEAETCQEFYGVTKCLRNVIDVCMDGETNPEIEKSLKDFDDYLDANCPTIDSESKDPEDETEQCLNKNKDYLLECVFDRETGEFTQLQNLDLDDIDPDHVQCLLYGLMSHCVVGRSEERCGLAGGQRAEEMLSSDLPASVEESCNSMDQQENAVQDFFAVDLLDQRKRRNVEYRKKRGVEYRKKRDVEYRKKRDVEYRKKRGVASWSIL